MIDWNLILYTYLCTKTKKFTIDNIFSRDACSESMYSLNHQIIEYPKNEKSDDGQTDRQNFISKNYTLPWKGSSKKYYYGRVELPGYMGPGDPSNRKKIPIIFVYAKFSEIARRFQKCKS